jgi:hypothetical protein
MIRPSRFLGARFFRPFYHPQRFYPVLFGPLRGLGLRFGPQVTVRELLGFWERNNFAAIIRLRDAGLLVCPHLAACSGRKDGYLRSSRAMPLAH